MQTQKADEPKTDPPTSQKASLNVIALISGGKDSLYSLLHCLANGHTVVALANLHPPVPGHNEDTRGGEGGNGATDADADTGEEDMNSYMYQTIGHRVIPLYEEALGIPLYRAPITGSAVDTRRVYHPGPGTSTDTEASPGERDETEALVPLLRHIQKTHPEANALSTGAILSTYQRTRVESVASRLGLISLSWLWMYPYLPCPAPAPAQGMQDIQDRETGLLDDMATSTCETRIIKVASGGLDSTDLWTNITSSDPGPRKRILRRMRRFASDGDARAAVLGEGGEYESLALDGPGVLWKRRIQIDDWERGVGEGENEGSVCFGGVEGRCVDKIEDGVRVGDVPRPGLFDRGFAGLLDGLEGEQVVPEGEEERLPEGVSKLGPGAEKQMLDIKNAVEHPEKIVFATVLLRSMDDFSSMNDIYTSLFPNPNPPARVTIACDLPPGVNVQVSFEYGPASPDRQGLLVQSRSYWAPANIGPYSQSISIPLPESGSESRLVYVAGQIPLEPASMDIVTGNYTTRAVLALQHLWRIGAAMQVNWWVCAVAYLTASGSGETKAQLAWKLWERMHVKPEEEEEEEVDIWDIKYGQGHAHTQTASLPDFSLSNTTPPFLAVQVADLPRNTDIEWQGLGCQCSGVQVEETDSTTTTTIQDYTTGVIEIGMEHADHLQGYINDILERYSHRLVVYTTQTVSCDALVIPCRGVWGRQGRRLIAGIRFSHSDR